MNQDITNNALIKELPFERSFASHKRSLYWSKENSEIPRNLALNCNRKFWFKCDVCCHDFQIALNNVNTGCWCPYCSNPPRRLCEDDQCQTCFEMSFASYLKAKFWSSKNLVTPRQVFKRSGTSYQFNCVCGHVFDQSPDVIVGGDTWCPYCSNPPKKLCDSESCNICFNKSFASHNNVKFWSSRNDCRPRTIFLHSSKKYWFNCSECGHDFECTPASIAVGCWCTFCANQKLCNDNECIKCFQKSFASHPKATYWSKNNNVMQLSV